MTLPANPTLPAKVLLKDKIYRKWISTPPKGVVRGVQPPWRVFVLKENGRWATKDFEKYSEAYNFMVRNLNKYTDIVIHSKKKPFKPPVVKYKGKRVYWPSPIGFRWCPYCRRPTKFRYFRKHHNLKIMAPWYKRCEVCGIRAESVPIYETPVPPTISV